MKTNRDVLIEHILKESEGYLSDEEFLAILLEKSKLPIDNDQTFSDKASDRLAKFAGSWVFIGLFGTFIVGWMLLNFFMLTNTFDPYPFILLNLVLSCVAAIQAPLIMMSQNRQEEKDRMRSRSDYRVNLKTKVLLLDIYDKVDLILKKQNKTDEED